MSDRDAVPAQSPGVVVADLRDEIALYVPEQQDALVLNRTAGDIWHLCDGRTTVGAIVTTLARAYQVEPSAIETEVLGVIDQLRTHGCLSVADGGG